MRRFIRCQAIFIKFSEIVAGQFHPVFPLKPRIEHEARTTEGVNVRTLSGAGVSIDSLANNSDALRFENDTQDSRHIALRLGRGPVEIGYLDETRRRIVVAIFRVRIVSSNLAISAGRETY